MAYCKAQIWTRDIPTRKQEFYPLYCRHPLDHSSICSLESNGGHGPLLHPPIDAQECVCYGWQSCPAYRCDLTAILGQNFRYVSTKPQFIWATQVLQLVQPAQRWESGLAAPKMCDQYRPISAIRNDIQGDPREPDLFKINSTRLFFK